MQIILPCEGSIDLSAQKKKKKKKTSKTKAMPQVLQYISFSNLYWAVFV